MASRELGGGKKKHSNGLRINSFRRREPEHITDDKRWKYGRGNRKWCHGERPIVGGLGRRHNRAGGGTSTGMGDTASGRWHKLVFCWRWRHRNRSPFGGTTATVCGCSSEAPSEWPSSSSFRQWYWPPFTVSAHTLWRETTKLVSTKVQLLHHCTLKKKKRFNSVSKFASSRFTFCVHYWPQESGGPIREQWLAAAAANQRRQRTTCTCRIGRSLICWFTGFQNGNGEKIFSLINQ